VAEIGQTEVVRFSWTGIGQLSEAVAEDHQTNLSHLVWLGLAPLALEVDALLDVRASEDVMTAPRPLLEAETE
jgi:hypothetical protein